MPNLTPTPGWDAVPQLETSTLARGGSSGEMNLQAQALLNRVEYLLSVSVKSLKLRSSSLAVLIPSVGSPEPATLTLTAEPSLALGGTATFSVIAGTASLVGSGNVRTIAASSMLTDSVTISATISGYTDTVTIVKVRDGSTGPAGASAPLLTLSATAQSVTFGPGNTPVPTSQTIAFTAQLANLTGTATFTCTLYDGSGGSLGPVTLGGSGNTRTLTQAQFGSAQYAVVQATRSGYTDQITVVRLKDGTAGVNPITGFLTNESVAVAADTAGTVASFAAAGGTYKVFNGLTDVTSAGPAYSVLSSTGVTVAINSTTGVYSVSAMSADTGSATLRAIFGGVTLDKVFTIAKSKAGATGDTGSPGAPGTPGANASLLTLFYTAQAVTFNAAGTASPASQTISFTAQLANLSGSATFSCTLYDAAGASLGPVTLGGTGNTRTLTNTQFGAAQYAVVQASLSGFSDQVTIVRLRDGAAGANSVSAFLTNESVTLAADSAGVVSSFAPAGGTFKVFNGTADVTGSGPVYSVPSSSNLTAAINSASGVYSVSAMSADTGTATLRAVYNGLTIDKVLSVSKSRAGATGSTGGTGAPGAPGANASLLVLLSTAQAVTFNAAGTASPSTQTISFTAQLSNLSGTATFTATLYDAGGSSLGTVVMGGSGNTRTLTNVQFGAAHYAIVQASLSGFSDQVTVVRLRDGASGANAISGYLTNESHTVTTAADGSGGDYATAGGTFRVFNGITDVTLAATFSIVSSSGITAMTINAATGAYALIGTTADAGTATLRAVYGGTTIDKVYTISRSKSGTNGTNGTNGLASAQVYIYQRAASVPALPSAAATYTFATGGITGLNNGWSATVPAGTNPLYVALATASSAGATDTIGSAEWSTPVVLVSNGATGAAGAAGAPGLNGATVFLYQRTSSSVAPAAPASTLTYTFATGALSGTLGAWSQTPPSGVGSYLWYTTASAASTGATDTIGTAEWAVVQRLAQDGINGEELFVNDGGFEIPSGITPWTLFSPGAIISSGAYAGSQCLAVQDTSGLVNVPAARNKLFLAIPGSRYRFSVAFKAGSPVPDGTARARLVWRDAAEANVGSPINVETSSAPAWTVVSATGVAPAGAVYGRVELVATGQTTGQWLMDAITVEPDGVPGATGATGAPGATASLMVLLSTSEVFSFNAAGTPVPSPQTITFTALPLNLSGTATFTATLYNAAGTSLGTVVMGGSGNTRTLTNSQFGAAQYAVVQASLGGFTDQITVIRVQDGLSGTNGTTPVVGLLTNESATLAADSAGVVGSFAGAGGIFKVFNGTTDVTGAGPVYSVQSVTGMSTTINATTGVYSVSGMTADTGFATLRAVFGGVTIDKTLTVAKSRAGAAGATGATGTAGAAGLNVAKVYIFRRSASAPALPSATATFTFATGAITGLNNSWSASVPVGTDPLYVALATASSTTSTDTIASTDWSSPVVLAQNGATGATGSAGADGATGAAGAPGLNSATVFLYQRTTSATPPALPGSALTYTFATGVLSGTLGSWSQTAPAGTGGYLWFTTATAASSSATDSIAAVEWAAVRKLAQDGATGARGNIDVSRSITGSAWSDVEATAAVADSGYGAPVSLDRVTLYNTGAEFVETRIFSGGTWITWATLINGNLIVDGSITTQALVVNAATAAQAASVSGSIGSFTAQTLWSGSATSMFTLATTGAPVKVMGTFQVQFDCTGPSTCAAVKLTCDILVDGSTVVKRTETIIPTYASGSARQVLSVVPAIWRHQPAAGNRAYSMRVYAEPLDGTGAVFAGSGSMYATFHLVAEENKV